MSNRKLGGANLRVLLRLVRELGSIVRNVPGTGEIEIFHPPTGERVRTSANRKDGARSVGRLIRRVNRYRPMTRAPRRRR